MGIFSKLTKKSNEPSNKTYNKIDNDSFVIENGVGVARFENPGNFEDQRVGKLMPYEMASKCKEIKFEIGASVRDSYIYVSNTTPVVCYTVDENNIHYKSIDGALYSRDGKILYKYPWARRDKSFTVPHGVTTIAYCAFLYAANLAEIILPSTVTTVEYGAFSDCTGLNSISLPEALTSIGENAFSNCASLSSISIPKNVDAIGISPFSGCKSLESILVDVENEKYTSIDGSLYTARGESLIQYASGKNDTVFVIPYSVSTICQSACIYSNNLKEVQIRGEITSIEKWAFNGCKSLETVFLSERITKIESTAFKDCPVLTILCEAPSLPSTWEDGWNYSSRPVEWGQKIKREKKMLNDGE